MFLRISGSSSMTNIFFMVFSKYGKPDRHNCSPANLAVHLEVATMQFRAVLHQQQAKTGAGPCPHVAAAMKCLEQSLMILFRNTDAFVTNNADEIATIPLHREAYRCA